MRALEQMHGGGRMIGDVVAASIAHEVKQPLTAIVVSAAAGFRFLDSSPPDLDRAKEAFKRIVADSHRAGTVVEDIRSSFTNEPCASCALDLNELIQGAIALERRKLERHDVHVLIELTPDLPAVRGNRTQLQQVLLNLIGNAVDAMTGIGGRRVLSVRSSVHGRDRVLVAVADTGIGVDLYTAERVFEPMFTTKPHGMGMGLAICRTIINAHRGKLSFVPGVPCGSVFQFTLMIDSPLGVGQS